MFVKPWKGKLRFGRQRKLTPRYIGPFPIEARIGKVAYKVQLPEKLQAMHNVFHISMLKKYIPDLSHQLEEPPVALSRDYRVEQRPVAILDRQERWLRRKVVPLVKVLWRSSEIEEQTWETEAEMKTRYPELFGSNPQDES